ncbi:MAG TPA: hypothetical protein VM029_22545 [Opitutaceae bacterium]|nr:hypothetical protein [Opitutaceae bacterium]
MNTLARRRPCSLLVALLAFCPVLRGQEPNQPAPKRPTPPSEIVITKGTFEWNGQKGPATLRRVVDAITSRYPRANITIVGADNVMIDDVTLRLRTSFVDGKEHVPLHGMLVALRAASRRHFGVDAFSENDFVLSGDKAQATVRAEVFKLGQSDDGKFRNAALRAEIAKLETELAVLGRRYGPDHPSMKDITVRRDVLKEQANQGGPSPAAPAKLLSDIQEVVLMTLERLRPGDDHPEFKYHSGTGLMVVIGSEEAIDVTRKVVDALK